MYEASASKGKDVDLRCVLVIEGVEIDLTGESNFDVLSANEFKAIETVEDIEYLSYLISTNYKKAQEKISSIGVEGYIFVTFRVNTQWDHSLIILPQYSKIGILAEELDKLEILTSILIDPGMVDSRYADSIENNCHIKMIREGKLR